MTYVQVAGGGDEVFTLEYQNGSLDEHYRAAGDEVTLEAVIEVFKSYAECGIRWHGLVTWELDEVPQPARGSSPSFAAALLRDDGAE